MIFHRIVRPAGHVVAVLPGPVRQIQPAHGRDDLLAQHVGLGFVGGVPDGQAGMVPVVAHPLLELGDQFARVPLPPGLRCAMAGPDEELVLDKQAGLIGVVQPEVRHRSDAETEAVPVHLLGNVDQQFPHPRAIPRQPSATGIFEETVQRDVGAAQKIGFAVEIGAARGRIEAEFPHAETRRDAVARRGRFERVKERTLGLHSFALGIAMRVRVVAVPWLATVTSVAPDTATCRLPCQVRTTCFNGVFNAAP